MTAARRATTPTTRRIANPGHSHALDRLASMSSASRRLPERFALRVPYVLLRTRPHRSPPSCCQPSTLDFAWGSTSMGYEDYFGCMIRKASGIDVDTMHLTE